MKPQNQDLALWRRTLTRGQSSADQYAKPVEAIIARSKTFEPASEGATVLLDNQVIRIHRNALTTRFRQRLIRVDSAASGETLTAIQLPYTPRVERLQVLRANVLRKDGSVERPVRMTDHRPAGRQNGIYTLTAYKTILFPKLEVGDIVHVQSESHDIADRGLFGPHFGALLPTQGPWPTLQARWVLEVPPELRLKTQVVGRGQWVEKTDTLDADGSLRLSWEATNLPAVRFEPSMPGYSDVAGYIQASSFTSWPELVRWYQGFIRDQLRLTPKLTALARTLTDGKHSIRTKVAAIHRWVVDNIRYVGIEFGIHGFKPYSLEEIVERGYGDCKDKAALFVALLDAVGIESDFALIRTRDRGSVGNDIASLWVFNHAIAYVPALDVYVDATSERALLGEVPALDQGGLLLRFPIVGSHRHTGVLTHLPFTPAPSNEFRSLGTIRLRADGSASATFNERIVGTAAAAMRSMLESPAEQSQRLGRLIARQHSGSVLRSFKVHAEGKGGTGGFELELEAELPSFAKRQGDELIIPVHSDPGGLLKKFASLGQRKHPLHLPYLSQDTTVSTVLTPGGAVATTVPEDKTVASTFGTYSLQVKRHSEGLRIEEVLTLDVSIINPKDYPAFRAFLEQVVGARRGRIVLRVGGKSVVSEPAQNTTND